MRKAIVPLLLMLAVPYGCRRAKTLEPLTGVFLYAPAVKQGRIAAFQLDQRTGVLNPLKQKSQYSGADTCREAALHPNAHVLYVHCMDAIVPFRIGTDGSLTAMKAHAYDSGMDLNRRMALHPSGRFLYLSGPAAIQLFKIAGDGSIEGTGGSYDSPNTGGLSISPDGRFLYAADRESPSLRKYKVDPANGSLAYEIGTSIRLRGGIATAMRFDPGGRFAFVLHSDDFSATVSSLRAGQLNGDLDSVATVSIGSRSGSLAVDPQSKYLYVADDRLPQVGVSAFRIEADGTLSELRASPYATEYSPYALLVDPSGNYLYAASGGFHVYGFQIDRSSGALSPLPGFHASTFGVTTAIVCTPQMGTAPAPVYASLAPPEPAPTPAHRTRFEPAAAGAPATDRLRDPNSYNRIVAAQEIGRGAPGTHDAIPNLIEALHDPEPNVVFAACTSLGLMGPDYASQTVSPLLEVAKQGSIEQRQLAAHALQRIDGGNPEVQSVIAQVEKDRIAGVKETPRPAAPLVPAAGTSLDTLLENLEKGSYYDRKSATAALVTMGPAAAPASRRLGELLFSPDHWTRRGAMEALESIDRDAGPAIPSLYGALLEPDHNARAARLIVRIRTGR